MTVKEHLEMLCTKFLETSLQTVSSLLFGSHFRFWTTPVKETHQRYFNTRVTPFLSPDDTITNAKLSKKEIHTAAFDKPS